MTSLLRIAALALPVAGLAGLWALSDFQSRQGSEWEVAISGYDPRDLLRGHYVEFSYDWEGLAGPEASMPPPERLCLEGDPPGPPVARRIEGAGSDCEYLAEADYGSLYGAESLLRGRLYVDQARAREIDDALRDRSQQAVVTVRLGSNRRLTPIAIAFRPASTGALRPRATEE